ncbi:hypothetical protein HK102_006247, partial [Quaeritorhiza haematococci]
MSADEKQIVTPSKDGEGNQRKKQFHIFISYRVRTDADLAEKLCDKLQLLTLASETREIRIKCFLDKQNLSQGRDFEEQFMESLESSCLFLPVISEANLEIIGNVQEGWRDNVLLEWECALEMARRGQIHIIPLLVGNVEVGKVDGAKTYRRFNGFGIPLPEVNTAHCKDYTVRDTVRELLRFQGVFLNPEELGDKLKTIRDRFSSDIWPNYRSQWIDLSSLGAEPTMSCVQCGKDFKMSENGEGACRFHKLASTGGLSTSDKDAGCQRDNHRPRHHNDYLYSTYYEWISSILSYTDRSEQYLRCTATDYSLTRGAAIADICVGRVKPKHPAGGSLYVWVNVQGKRWFEVFARSDMDGVDWGKRVFSVKIPGGRIWAEGTWVYCEEEEFGLEIRAGVKDQGESCKRIFFTWDKDEELINGPKVLKKETVSTQTFHQYKPKPIEGTEKDDDTPYRLPPRMTQGPTMVVPKPRTREFFNPWSASPDCKLRVKVDKVEAVYNGHRNRDVYIANLTVINPLDRPVTVMSANAFWRLRCFNEGAAPEKKEDADEFLTWKAVDQTFAT